MIQQSLFPDEVPHKGFAQKRYIKDWRGYLRRFLRHEGFYNFARMAEQLYTLDENTIKQYYNVEKSYLIGMCESVFGEDCNYQETIASFLVRTRTETAYSLNPIGITPTHAKRSAHSKKS